MRITTWNVNGIRAMLKKNAWDWVKDFDPDVIGLQEIKAMPEQLTEEQHSNFSDRISIWNPAQRKGYSGTALFSKLNVLSENFLLGEERFDIEGRLIETKFKDFTLFNIYFPNGGRDLSRVSYKLDFYALLLEKCDQMHAAGEKIIITGDFNTAHEEIDLFHPKPNRKNTGFLPEEREWVTKFVEHGFVDAFRALHPDKVKYSWWSYRANARANNVGWRIDYFMVSEALMPKVKDVEYHNDVMGSDHCPVTIHLKS
jgi:exodeoxyribonuclease-3